jgi:hypothetical protein
MIGKISLIKLIRLIYESTELEYVYVNSYCPITGEKTKRRFSNSECNCVELKECKLKRIQTDKNIHYKISSCFEDEEEIDEIASDDCDLGSKIRYLFEGKWIEENVTDEYDVFDPTKIKKDLKKVLSSGVVACSKYKITLMNCSGINDDHRGSDHTKIILPFQEQYVLKNNSLKELIKGLYKIKSHKFDKWYELFSTAKVEFYSREIFIKLDFDHGS